MSGSMLINTFVCVCVCVCCVLCAVCYVLCAVCCTCRVHEVDGEEMSLSLGVRPSPDITLVCDTCLDRPSTVVKEGSRE